MTRLLDVSAEDPSEVAEGMGFDAGLPPGAPLIDYRQQFEIETLKQELKRVEAELAENTDRHELRKRYSGRLFLLVLTWISTVWIFIALQGFGVWPWCQSLKFKLSDTVLITYITSTTASVLGLFGIAAYWLFGKRKPVSGATEDKSE